MVRSLVAIVGALATIGALVPALPAVADPLGALPVPAVEVTGTDTSIRDTAREVVVYQRTGSGAPQLRKFRASTGAAAARLAADLDGRSGLVAAVNSTLRATATALENEPDGAAQADMRMIGAPAAWSVSTGAGVTVAVLDTGVDATNPDLAGRVLPELDMLPDVTTNPDTNGHGTLVASLVAAGLNSYGIAGVAPSATILPVAALDPMGYGDIATVAEAIVAATNAGARVINMSLGGPDRSPVLDAACAYAHARGVLLVAAAGNSRTAGNRAQYPAASPYVLAVGSVDSNGVLSYFSNTGKYIDLVAPGEGIVGAAPGGGESVMDGTSAAAPHVSGALALAASANPSLSADDLIDSVLGSAVRAQGAKPDHRTGYGLLRADLAVTRAQSKVPPAAAVSVARRVDALDAAPEPIRRGHALTVVAKVAANYDDGQWRPAPGGSQVVFEFKRSGTRSYQQVGVAPTLTGGYAVTQVAVKRSGRWRAAVILADGSRVVGRSDYVKVRK
jgi:subtilisin family serine protease